MIYIDFILSHNFQVGLGNMKDMIVTLKKHHDYKVCFNHPFLQSLHHEALFFFDEACENTIVETLKKQKTKQVRLC